MQIDNLQIGMRIRQIRQSQHKTHEQLSKFTGLSLTHISNIENGKSSMSIESLVNIANFLGVSTDVILFGGIQKEDDPMYADYVDLMLGCTEAQSGIILETARSLKKALKNRLE